MRTLWINEQHMHWDMLDGENSAEKKSKTERLQAHRNVYLMALQRRNDSSPIYRQTKFTIIISVARNVTSSVSLTLTISLSFVASPAIELSLYTCSERRHQTIIHRVSWPHKNKLKTQHICRCRSQQFMLSISGCRTICLHKTITTAL